MRSLLLVVLASLLTSFVVARQEVKPEPPKGVVIGQDLPEPINPYNATGPAIRRFHDPIGPHALDPFVLILTSDTEPTDETKELLKLVDNVIEKNMNVRLAACCIFFSGDIKDNVVTDDDPRDNLLRKLNEQAKMLELKHVILAIDSPNNLPKYADVLVGTRAIVLNRLRVAAIFGGDKFDAAAKTSLETFLTEKIGAKKR